MLTNRSITALFVGYLFSPVVLFAQPVQLPNPLPEVAFRIEPREVAEQQQFYAKSLGTAVATLADFDGDQIGDYVVGAPRETGTAPRSGRVYVYSSRTDRLLGIIEGAEADGRFGASVDVADADGDCVGEILIGAPGEASGRGRAHVYRLVNGQFVGTVIASGVNGDELGKSVVFLDGPAGSLTEKAVVLGTTQYHLLGVSAVGTPFAIQLTGATANTSALFVAAAGRIRQPGRYDFAIGYAAMTANPQSYVEYHSSVNGSSLGDFRLGSLVQASSVAYIESQTVPGMDDTIIGATARADPNLTTFFGIPFVTRAFYASGNWYNQIFTQYGGTAVQDREFGSSIVVPDQTRILVGSPGRREPASSGAIVEMSAGGSVLGTRGGESVTLRSGSTLALLDTTPRLCTGANSSSGGVVIAFPTPTPTPSPTPAPGGGLVSAGGKGFTNSPSAGSSNLVSGRLYVLDARPIEKLRDSRLHNGYANREEVGILDAGSLALVHTQYGEFKSTEFGAAVRGQNLDIFIGGGSFPSLVVGSPGSDRETGKVELIDSAPIVVPTAGPFGDAPRRVVLSGSQIGERFGEAISQVYTCASSQAGYCVAVGVPSANEVRVFSMNASSQVVGTTTVLAPANTVGFGSAVLAGWFLPTQNSGRQLVVASQGGAVTILGRTAPFAPVATINPPVTVGPSRAVLEVTGDYSLPPNPQGLLIGYPEANQGIGAVVLLRDPVVGGFNFILAGQGPGDEFGAAVTSLPSALTMGSSGREFYAVGAPGANQGAGRVDIFNANGALLRSINGTVPGGRFGAAVSYTTWVINPHFTLLVGAPEDGDGKVYAYDPDTGLQLSVIASNRVASQFGSSLTSGFTAFAGAPQYDLAGYASGGVTAIVTGERQVGYSQRVGVGSRELDLTMTTIPLPGGVDVSVSISGARPSAAVFLALSKDNDIFGLPVPQLGRLLSWFLNPIEMDTMFLGTTDGQGNLTVVLPQTVRHTLRGFTYNFQALVGSELTPARKLIL